MRVAFIHPDLGIGGAERLVVDAALCLKSAGHDVVIYTSYRNPQHCFPETIDGTLNVEVIRLDTIPRTIGGKFSILCAILQQFYLVNQLIRRRAAVDVFVVDQLSACIPKLVTRFPRARVLFYGHFPDLRLSRRGSLAKRCYRLPFDALEGWSTCLADKIVVNSIFTQGVFVETFGARVRKPDVVYPAVAVEPPFGANAQSTKAVERIKGPIFLSLNRFERTKNVELALEAFSLLLHSTPETHDAVLVIAGGYDERVMENVEYLAELRVLATKFRLPSSTIFPGEPFRVKNTERVLFVPSVSTPIKDALLERARLLLYTPTNEHFGIVPLEAMRVGTPVLATNSGGPLETIVDGKTGWLREPDMDPWHRVMGYVLLSCTDAEYCKIADNCRERVRKHFSINQLRVQMERAVAQTAETPRSPTKSLRVNLVLLSVGLSLVCLAIALWYAVSVSRIYVYRFVAYAFYVAEHM